MDRQKFIELCEIVNEILEEEVRKYFRKSHSQRPADCKISFFGGKGDMLIASNYVLVGDGDGSNPILKQLNGSNKFKEAPVVIIEGGKTEESIFEMRLGRPNKRGCMENSFFLKETSQNVEYSLKGEQILGSDEFRECIIKMFEDIAPQRLQEVVRLLF